ncbi:MAG: hypothetical protein ACK5MD_04995 [Flavobacteriales bacterium]
MKNSIKYYVSNTASRVLLGEKVTEFKNAKLFSIHILEFNSNILHFEYKLLRHSTEGNAIIHKWIENIDEFQNRLIVHYNFDTKNISIKNLSDLQEHWKKSFKSLLKNKFPMKGGNVMVEETEKVLFNEKQFEKQFLGYTFLRAFLNGLSNISTNSDLVLEKYFGDLDLILKLETEELNDNNTFKSTAKINEDLFDKKKLNKIIRDFTHTIDAKAELEIDMEEIYELDEDNFLKQADLYLDTSVISGFYHITNAHQVQQISENEFLERINIQEKSNRHTFLAE